MFDQAYCPDRLDFIFMHDPIAKGVLFHRNLLIDFGREIGLEMELRRLPEQILARGHLEEEWVSKDSLILLHGDHQGLNIRRLIPLLPNLDARLIIAHDFVRQSMNREIERSFGIDALNLPFSPAYQVSFIDTKGDLYVLNFGYGFPEDYQRYLRELCRLRGKKDV